MSSESDIRAITSSTAYSPSSIPALEGFLDQQLAEATHSPCLMDAARTLVKLYQLFPGSSARQDELTAAAYFLSMTYYPSTDNLALSYFLSPTVLATEPVATIQTAADQLQACEFSAFWNTYETLKTNATEKWLAPAAQQAVPRLQAAIAQVLALTYQEAPVSVVAKAVHVADESKLAAECQNFGAVEKVEGDVVTFVASVDNTKRQRVYQEGVNFATVSALLSEIA